MPNAGGLADRVAGRVHAAVHARDDPREADRIDVEDRGRVDVVAAARRVAGHREDVADPEGMGPQEVALDTHEVPVAAGEVHADVETGRLANEERGRENGHPDPPQRPVVDVHDLDAALGEELRALHELLDVVAARRIELHGDQELAGRGAARGVGTARPSPPARESLAARVSRSEPPTRRAARGPAPRPVAVHHLAHGPDVSGSRPAAAPDDTRAGVQHAGGVVGHVGRRREVDQPLAVPARQAGVRPDRQPGSGRGLVEEQPRRRRARSSPRRSWRR